jgi:peptidyl-prolyl cis-trans isomerase B (cyclophilin B)
VSTTPGAPHGRTWVTMVALGVLVAALVGVAIGVNRVAGSNSGAGIPTATPAPSASPTPSAAPTPAQQEVAFADCSTATFGDPLPAQNAPGDVHTYKAVPPPTIDDSKLYQLTIVTAKGTMVGCLQPSLAPKTVNVIVTLARNHFYDGLKFHRVVADFVIQGGDPQGTGSGGPGFKFDDEPVLNSYVDGALAMANSGPNTNGSQFFVCTVDDRHKLAKAYNLFGQVIKGMDVVLEIQPGDRMKSVTVAES